QPVVFCKKICPLLRSQCVDLSPGIQFDCVKPIPLKIPVIATVPNGPALNVCGGAAVDSGAVMDGVGSGAGAEGAAAGAGVAACPEASAGGVVCPAAGI